MTLICNDFHQSLLIINYSSDASFLWYVVPLFQAVGLQLIQVLGLSSTDPSFELSPQILDGVEIWGLAGPLQQVNVVVPKPCLDDFGCVFGVIVLLEDKAPAQMELPRWLEEVLLKNLLIQRSIPGPPDADETARAMGREASPQHDAATTMLDCGDGVTRLVCLPCLAPDRFGGVVTKQF